MKLRKLQNLYASVRSRPAPPSFSPYNQRDLSCWEQGADPSDKPMLDHRLHDRRLSNEQLIGRVDQLADQGFRGVTISYEVWPDQVDVIVAETKRRGMATLAEPALTPYPYAIHSGVSGLLRNDHYLLELARPYGCLSCGHRAARLGSLSKAGPRASP
jgi:hypothetical protein